MGGDGAVGGVGGGVGIDSLQLGMLSNSSSAECGGPGAGHLLLYGGDARAQVDDEYMVGVKLSGLATEYEHLLATQLEEQRHHYEQLLAREAAKSASVAEAIASASERAAVAEIRASLTVQEGEYRSLIGDLRDSEASLRTAKKVTAALLEAQHEKEAKVSRDAVVSWY